MTSVRANGHAWSLGKQGKSANMSAIDTRNIPRDSLFLLGQLRVEGSEAEHRIKIRNLSAGGMMTDCTLQIARGARVTVELRNIGWVKGAVAWVQGDRIGVAFDDAIDPKLARTNISTNGDVSTPRFVRPASILPSTSDDLSRLRKI